MTGVYHAHVCRGIGAATANISVPLPIFDRNQGEIARTHFVETQAQQQQQSARGQVFTDVRDAFEAVQSADRVARFYQSGHSPEPVGSLVPFA